MSLRFIDTFIVIHHPLKHATLWCCTLYLVGQTQIYIKLCPYEKQVDSWMEIQLLTAVYAFQHFI